MTNLERQIADLKLAKALLDSSIARLEEWQTNPDTAGHDPREVVISLNMCHESIAQSSRKMSVEVCNGEGRWRKWCIKT